MEIMIKTFAPFTQQSTINTHFLLLTFWQYRCFSVDPPIFVEVGLVVEEQCPLSLLFQQPLTYVDHIARFLIVLHVRRALTK